jgi:TetR/AcrR family transcriptional regulator, cholesterol catabolism regulator
MGPAPPVSTAPATVTVHRRLTAPQQARRERVLAAATELAEEGGYDAVAMKDVAERSGVALATVYRYFGSKDHLLAEVLVVWGAVLSERLDASPPTGATPTDRVVNVLRRAARAVELQPRMAEATTAALLSRDPGVVESRAGFTTMMQGWLDHALSGTDVAERDAVIEILEHVFFSTMVSVVTGRRQPREVGDQLERAARLLLAHP